MVCAGALLLAAPAAAHEKHEKRAKVSKARLAATDDGEARGRAHLVDGKRRDKVSLHMKGLEPGETYRWEVREGECDDEAAAASEGWTYRELKVRPSGNANAKGRSKTFRGDENSVAVMREDGTVVACGDFERKRHRHHGDDDDGDRDKRKGHGRGHRKP